VSAPRIWLVLGDKPGDNAQVEIVAEAMGLPVERKRVIPRAEWVLGKPRIEASIDHLDSARSDPLEPPWPDLILTIGRRPSMAALWIQEQSHGNSRIVLFGPPKRWPERFSLIVAPAQYQITGAANAFPIRFPLMRSNAAGIEAARLAWSERLGAMPRPLTALLVGGQTKPYRLDARFAAELAEQARALASPGSLYASTSRRTLPTAVEALASGLPPDTPLFCWAPDATDNPYLGLLALADRFIVTGDSISMMVEVARIGKPLAIAALPYRNLAAGIFHRWVNASTGIPAALRAAGITRGARDLSAMHRVLYDRGLAAPMGEGFPEAGREPLEDELPRVAAAVRALLQL
jgi:mitochondrial fission protein ELM1